MLGDFAEAHGGEHAYRSFVASLAKRHPEEAADRVLGRNVTGTRGLCFSRVRGADDLQPHTIGVGEAKDLLLKPLTGAFRGDARGQQTLLPERKRCARNAECGGRSFSHTQAAPRGVRPREERKDRAWRPGIVSKVEVIGSGIVEVDGAFYETEPQHFGVEVEVPLRVGSNRGDVM